MGDKIKGITIEIGGNVTPLNKALKEVNGTAKGLQNELGMVNKALKFDTKNTDLVKQKQALLKEAIGNTSKKLETLKEAQRQADQQMKDGIDIDQEQYRKLQREIAFTESKLENYKDELKKTKLTLDDVADSISKIGKKSEAIGKKLLPVSVGITAVGTGAAKMASDFEDSMAKVSTIADTSKITMEDLRTSIVDLSNETGVGASELAQNVYDAISAGQKTEHAVGFVTKATRLAKAGFTETGSALDILSTIMNAYGLEAEEVGRVSDQLIQTQNLGKTTVAELSSSMGKVIPTAKANSVALDQVCSAYSIMTANGIATAETTTYLNSMLNELGKGGTGVDKILREKTGKSFKELSADGASLGDVLWILNEHANESGMSFGDLWSSSEAGKAGMILLGDSAEDFNSTLVKMNDAVGTTDKAFEKMDTQSNQNRIMINRLKNTMIDLGTTILKMITPYIEKASMKVKELSQWFAGLTEGQKKAIVKTAGVIAILGPMLIVFGKICTSVSAIIRVAKNLSPVLKVVRIAFSGLNKVMLANPIMLVVTACIALIGILVTLYLKCDWFREAVDKIWLAIKKSFFKVWDAIADFFTKTLPNLINGAVKWFKLMNQKFKDMMKSIWERIKKFGRDTKNFITVKIPNAIKMIVQYLKELPGKVWTWLKATLNKIGDFCIRMVQKSAEAGSQFVRKIIEFIKNLPSNLWNWLRETLSKVASWTTELIKKGKKAGKGLFDAVVNGVKKLPSKMKSIGGDIVRGVWNGIKNMTSWLNDKVSGFFGGVVDGVKKVLGIHSPSRVMAKEVGEHMPSGVAVGIERNADVVDESLETVLGRSVENTRSILSSFDYNPRVNLSRMSLLGTNMTSNHYGQNHIEIHCNQVDKNSIDEICNEINYRLGMAY